MVDAIDEPQVSAPNEPVASPLEMSEVTPAKLDAPTLRELAPTVKLFEFILPVVEKVIEPVWVEPPTDNAMFTYDADGVIDVDPK